MNDEKNKPPNKKNKKGKKDENNLFRDSVGDVKRYHHNKVEPDIDRPKPIPRKTQEDEQQVFADMLSDEYNPEENNATDRLFFVRDGIQKSVIRKLKRGHFNIDAELDLHGLTINNARQELANFLAECANNDWRCVRIIHGKGNRSGGQGPVLKQKVNHWLPQRNEVLAFSSTIPAHGGTGAIYVLLRRKK